MAQPVQVRLLPGHPRPGGVLLQNGIGITITQRAVLLQVLVAQTLTPLVVEGREDVVLTLQGIAAGHLQIVNDHLVDLASQGGPAHRAALVGVAELEVPLGGGLDLPPTQVEDLAGAPAGRHQGVE